MPRAAKALQRRRGQHSPAQDRLRPSDEEIEFNFLVAKALGCVGITTERSDAMVQRLAPFAEKHRIWVGFHNHTANFPALEADALIDAGNYLGFNFDVGHYVAGTKANRRFPCWKNTTSGS
jgi:sugar phosphate isomerase/epimerase